MKLHAINHINLCVQNLERARPFYEGFLALRAHPSYDGAYLLAASGPLLVLLEFPLMKTPDLQRDRHQLLKSSTLLVGDFGALLERARSFDVSVFAVSARGAESTLPPIDLARDSGAQRQLPALLGARDHDLNLWKFSCVPAATDHCSHGGQP